MLWLFSRLADGLAHAHDRGILHHDLKPANILITDEGQPMLLDFNLATTQANDATKASIGGTLPYMAPEQLDAFRGNDRVMDERSDIYSLGIILYQALAGRHPFSSYRNAQKETVLLMMSDRLKLPPPLQKLNPGIPYAVNAIVQKCLHPEPKERYQSAKDLQEDLERQLNQMPLRYTPEPSLKERVCKWIWRHPKLTSGTTVGITVAVLLLIPLLWLAVAMFGHSRSENAQSQYQTFQSNVNTVRFLLNNPSFSQAKKAKGIALAKMALRQFADNNYLRYLTTIQQDQLQKHQSELAWLLANVYENEQAELALHFNEMAAKKLATEQSPRILLEQRLRLLTSLGKTDLTHRLQTDLQNIDQSAGELALLGYWQGMRHLSSREFDLALSHFQKTLRKQPQHFWSWFLSGVCHDHLAQLKDATACYNTCVAMNPEFSWSYFNRGLTQMHLENFEESLSNFEHFIGLMPEACDAFYNRALVYYRLGEHQLAIEDLQKAKEKGFSPIQVHLMKAIVFEKMGELELGKKEQEAGLAYQPETVRDWVSRGYALMESNPTIALTDFDQALALDPRSLEAMQNKAYVLAEKLHRPAESIALLTELIRVYPEYVPARSGRGILYARSGRRDEAHQDAQESLNRDTSIALLYQVAGIYAQTSKGHSVDEQPMVVHHEDALEAIRLLSTVLRHGWPKVEIEKDRDLEPLRNLPAFQQLMRK